MHSRSSDNPDLRILEPGRYRAPLVPGHAVVKPGVILAGNQITKFASWCQIDRANPTVNQNLNAGTVNANTDNNSYDGSVNAQKMIFNFEAATSKTGTGLYLVLGKNPAAGGSIGGISAIPGGVGNSFVIAMTYRIRPITASFVTSSQTWNNFGSLSLGAAVTWLGPALSGPVSLVTPPVFPNPLSFSTNEKAFIYIASSISAVYGYVVDCVPSANSVYGPFTYSSISAGLQAASLTTVKPFLLVVP